MIAMTLSLKALKMNTTNNIFRTKFSKMFAAAEKQTTEQLKEAFTIMELLPITQEISISKAVIGEVLIDRIGEAEFDIFIDAFEIAA